MSKKVVVGIDALNKILVGINTTADAVKITLGPGGRTAILEKYSSPEFTKDGVKVAKSISLSDKEADLGCQVAKNVAAATVEASGDGTSTATVLLQKIFQTALSLYQSGVSPTELRDGVKFGVGKVIEYLRKQAQHISLEDTRKLQEVATISANGDTSVGRLIAQIIQDIGKDGIVTVEDGKSTETTSEKVEGMKVDQGFKSIHFVNNQQKQVCEFDNAHVMVYDKKLDSAQQAQQIAEILEKYVRNEPLVIIAEDVADPVLALLVINSLRQTIKVCAIKAPGFGDTRSAMAEDIAIFTGATYMSDTTGRSLDDFTPHYLGRAKKIIIDSKSTTIIGGNGDHKEIESRCDVLKAQLSRETSEYAKNKLEDRIAKLKGKAGMLYVGGVTEAEQKELKDRVEDAVQAVKAAITGGILPGGGSTYIRASLELEKLVNEIKTTRVVKNSDNSERRCTDDFIWGIQVVEQALSEPLKQALINAGMLDEWQTVISKIKEHSSEVEFGYDIAKSKFCNMIMEGIIDPTECSVAAIKNAGHTAAILIGSGAMVTDKPEPKGNNNSSGMDY